MAGTSTDRERFTNLDLAQAYLQVPLELQSRQLVTITTHKGLYRYTRMFQDKPCKRSRRVL